MECKVLLIDDSATDSTRIKSELTQYCDDIFDATFTIKNKINNLNDIEFADLYLLDIDMPIDGFTIANHILNTNKHAHIIFITSHDDLVFDSFGINTFYFVRKSKLESDLKRGIEKYKTELLEKKYVVCNFHHDSHIIKLTDIQWVEVQRNDLHIHTLNTVIRIKKTLKIFAESLPKKEFIRIHSSYIVNINAISQIKNNTCILLDQTKLAISNKYKKSLIKQIECRDVEL